MSLHQAGVRLDIVGITLVAMSLTCGEGTGPPGPVAKVVVKPPVDSMFVGDSVRLTVELRDSSDHVVTDRVIVWSVSDTGKATVRATGWVIARTAESFAVTAISEGIVGGAFLTGQYPVASLALPESITIARYDSVQLIPDVRSQTGTPLSGRAATWSTADPNVLALLSTPGMITPLALGVGRVIARSFGHADTSIVTVVPESVATIILTVSGRQPLPPGAVVPVIATFYDRASRATAGVPLTWTSSDPTLADVAPDPSVPFRGLLTPRAQGTVTLRATGGGVIGETTVTIRPPVARMTFSADSFNLFQYSWLTLVPVTLRDSLGNAIDSTDAVTLRTTDPTIVSLTSPGGPGSIGPLRAGRTTVIGTLPTGEADTALIIVPPSGSPRLYWGVPRGTYALRAEAAMQLAALDSFANNADLPVTVVSTDTSVLRPVQSFYPHASGWFSVFFDLKGPGEAQLVASSGSVFASTDVTVVDVPVSSLTLTPRFWTMTTGDSLRLVAVARTATGTVLQVPVQWTSSDAAIATVAGVPGATDTGVVTALAGGDVYVTAMSEGKQDVAHIVLTSPNAPSLDSVRPALLVAGSSGTLYGGPFDSDPSRNTLTLNGMPVLVTAATSATVTFTIPPASNFPCVSTRPARLLLSSGGRVASTLAPFAPAPQPQLVLGQTLMLTASELQCLELGLGQYVIAVVNTTPDPAAIAAFELTGQVPTDQPPPAPPLSPPQREVAPPPLVGSPAEGERMRSAEALRLHLRVLEESRRLVQRAGPPVPLLRAQLSTRPPQLSVVDTIGSVASIRVPRIDYPDFCSRYETITARRVYSGTRTVLFEDTSAPLAGKVDTWYQGVGQEFDDVMYPKLVAGFGDPLALDSLLDRNGRVAMVFTPKVNAYGVGGFVVSCDFYPETVAPSSNTGEILYAPAATPVPAGFPIDAGRFWWWRARTTVMHEGKHLAAFAERLKRGAPIEDVWLEEASAVVAEELWSRDIYGTSWKGNATYRQTLYCDVRPSWPECAGRPLSMFNPFAFFYEFARAPYRHSPLGGTSADDATYYGSAWSLLRWTIDQTAVNEQDFLRALTQEPALTGVANLEARAGRPFSDLVTDWLLASVVDDERGFAPDRPQLQQPSWNTPDIFNSMSGDFPAEFPDPWPFAYFDHGLQDFDRPVPELHGGSAAYFYISAYLKVLLRLQAPGGGPPDPKLRVGIIRVF